MHDTFDLAEEGFGTAHPTSRVWVRLPKDESPRSREGGGFFASLPRVVARRPSMLRRVTAVVAQPSMFETRHLGCWQPGVLETRCIWWVKQPSVLRRVTCAVAGQPSMVQMPSAEVGQPSMLRCVASGVARQPSVLRRATCAVAGQSSMIQTRHMCWGRATKRV